MPIYKMRGTISVTQGYQATSPQDAIRQWQKDMPGIHIDSINDEDFIGLCESCGAVCMNDDTCGQCDPVILCLECYKQAIGFES